MRVEVKRLVPEPLRSAARSATTVTAHAGSLATEANTPESFRAALAFPIDYLEADVRFTPANAAYLAHDALPSLQQEKAMSLSDLLRLAAAHPTVRLNLDLKEYSGVRQMSSLVRRSGMGSRVLLTGITADVVSSVRADAGGLPYLLNARPGVRERFTRRGAAALARRIRACGALGLNVRYGLLTRRLARLLSEAGLSLSVWTVDDDVEMRRMIGFGVDNITTRRIDRLLAIKEV